MQRNVIVGQSGGPTAAINSSLAGVYRTAKDRGAKKVYGMLHGVQGLLEEGVDPVSDEKVENGRSRIAGRCQSVVYCTGSVYSREMFCGRRTAINKKAFVKIKRNIYVGRNYDPGRGGCCPVPACGGVGRQQIYHGEI